MFGDISKSFGRSFLVAHVVPSAILCAAIVVAMKTGVIDKGWARHWRVFEVSLSVFLPIVIFGVAILSSLFSKQIVRIYEGYSQDAFLWYGIAALVGAFGQASIARNEFTIQEPIEWTLLITAIVSFVIVGLHETGKQAHIDGFKDARDQIKDPAQAADRPLRRYAMARNYPQDENLILATKFGNILRAFEHYPLYAFGMEPITMWYRLVALVPEAYRTQLEDAEASVQFFLNLTTVAVIFAVGSIFAAFHLARPSVALLVFPFLGCAFLLYRAACAAAGDWGEQVRSVFDLYRFDLLKQLAVAIPEVQPWSLQVERDIWKRAQRLTFYQNRDADTRYAPKTFVAPDKPVDDINV